MDYLRMSLKPCLISLSMPVSFGKCVDLTLLSRAFSRLSWSYANVKEKLRFRHGFDIPICPVEEIQR